MSLRQSAGRLPGPAPDRPGLRSALHPGLQPVHCGLAGGAHERAPRRPREDEGAHRQGDRHQRPEGRDRRSPHPGEFQVTVSAISTNRIEQMKAIATPARASAPSEGVGARVSLRRTRSTPSGRGAREPRRLRARRLAIWSGTPSVRPCTSTRSASKICRPCSRVHPAALY